MIDLDANATTAMLPEVMDAILPWLRGGHANPSGAYAGAKVARRAIERAREQVASLIGAEVSEIVFTSGGTESVNTGLCSLDRLVGRGEVVVSAVEHSAVLRCVESFERGAKVVGVDGGGRLRLDEMAGVVEGAGFVSVMVANNETGVLQPVEEVVGLARERGLAVHTDGIQAVGKRAINVRGLGVDLLSLSAHKFHGPKGVGALYVREGLRFSPLLRGGGQEGGRRSGTENTAGIVAMGAAAECAAAFLDSGGEGFLKSLRDAFEERVLAKVPGCVVNGDVGWRLANTSHLSFEQCDAAGLLILLDEMGVACSAGSACMTGKQRPSHVQLAMGIPEGRARSSLRISFSRLNTLAEAEEAAVLVGKAVEKLRRVQAVGVGPVVVYSA